MQRLAIIALLTLGAPAVAEPVKLSGSEIRTVLTGNTVHGAWAGHEYWSYFAPDGRTAFLPEGYAAPYLGNWRVEGSQYCSSWSNGDAGCYNVYKEGDKIIWETPEDRKRYDSQLLNGDRLPKLPDATRADAK